MKNTHLQNLTELASLFSDSFNWLEAENIPEPKWKTNRLFPLHQGAFIRRYSDELSLLGVGFASQTRYCMFDIDRDSKHHPRNNPQAFARLLSALENIGLIESIVIRSSDNEGIHIYYYFSKPLHTFRLASYLKVKLIKAGYKIENGQLEIFPNTKAFGTKEEPSYHKPHRLPLQPDSGSILLDNEGQPLCTLANASHENMVAEFLHQAKHSAARNDIDKIEEKLNHCYQLFKQDIARYQHLGKTHSEIAHGWSLDLIARMTRGWTDNGQTNEILPKFIAYGIVFQQIEDKPELFQWVKTAILNTPGYPEYCRHQHEIDRIIWGWVNQTIDDRYYVKYCGFPERYGVSIQAIVKQAVKRPRKANQHNIQLANKAKEQIQQIVTALTNIPSKVKELIQIIQAKSQELFGTKISKDTLYKPENKTLWQHLKSSQQPQQQPSQNSTQKPSDPTLTKNQPQAQSTQHIQPQICKQENKKQKTSTPDTETRSYPKSLYETFVIKPPAGGSVPIDGDSNLDLLGLEFTEIPTVRTCESTADLTHSDLDPVSSDLNSNCDPVLEVTTESSNELELSSSQNEFTLNLESDLYSDSNLDSTTTQDSESDLDLTTSNPLHISSTYNSATPPKTPNSISETYQSHPDEFECAPQDDLRLTTYDLRLTLGIRLKRNPQRVHGKNYPALLNCEIIGRNGLDWQVKSPSGALFNVSNYAIEHGDWEVEPEEELSPSVLCPLSSVLCLGATVRTVTGLIGVIKHIFPAHAMDKSIVVLIGEARLRFAVDELEINAIE